MSMPVNYGSVTKKEALRWSVCFAAVLLLHGGLAAALLTRPQDEGDVLDNVTSVEVEFTSEAFKEAMARDVAPGEEQMQTDVAPPPMEKAEQKTETETPTPPVPQVENPEVALQVEPEKKEEKKEDEKEKNPNAAPPLVSASTTTAPTAAAVRSASAVSWKRKIAMHLQRNKRYPAAAQAKREHGIARVAFLVDRLGRVVSSTLIQSSGSTSLDRETLDLLQRAQPFPLPPADVAGAQFGFNVPVSFDLK